MSTLNDLRATLDEHAEGLHDTALHDRPVAVRARVRAVRRRRAGVVAAAAVVVLVAAVAVTGALRGPRTVEPAGRTVVGVDVPSKIDVLGFPYRLESTRSVGRGSVTLDRSGTERAVVLVGHGLGSGSATLFLYDDAVARVRGDEQVAVPYLAGDGELDLRVRLDGAPAGARAGLAVYGATGATAPGVAKGRAVFRDRVAGAPLRTAAFSEGDAAHATVHVAGRLDRLGISDYCRSDQKGLWVQVSVDGDGSIGSECTNADRTDAGSGWATLSDSSAGTHTVEVYVTRGAEGPRVDSGATVGVGVYGIEAPATRLLGSDVERTVETAGRTWVLDRVVDGDRTSVDTADGDRLLGFLGAGERVWTTYRGRLVHGQSSSMSTARGVHGAGRMLGTVLLAGDRYDVRLRTARPTDTGALLVYRPE